MLLTRCFLLSAPFCVNSRHGHVCKNSQISTLASTITPTTWLFHWTEGWPLLSFSCCSHGWKIIAKVLSCPCTSNSPRASGLILMHDVIINWNSWPASAYCLISYDLRPQVGSDLVSSTQMGNPLGIPDAVSSFRTTLGLCLRLRIDDQKVWGSHTLKAPGVLQWCSRGAVSWRRDEKEKARKLLFFCFVMYFSSAFMHALGSCHVVG